MGSLCSRADCLPAFGNNLTLHASHRRGCVLLPSACVRNFLELPSFDPALELLSDSAVRGFSHAALERHFENRTTILYSRLLEDMIARPSHGLLRLHLQFLPLMLPVFARLADYAVRLVPKPCGQLAVPL